MSFGYLQGQEALALGYYKKLLEMQTDPKIRQELQELVSKLEKFLSENTPQTPPGIIQHASH